jgi:hypothetical protein
VAITTETAGLSGMVDPSFPGQSDNVKVSI